MIRLLDIIELLRSNLPSWSIEGAIDLSIAEDASRLPLPAMYLGLGPVVYEDTSPSTYYQKYTQNFFIIACVPTKSNDDRTGKYGQDSVSITRGYLLNLLVNNMQFDPDSHVIMLVKDQPEKLDRARYYHRFDFKIQGALDQNDVTPLELDYFDKLFTEYVPEESTDDTPFSQQEIQPLYFTTDS
jgi:hypothetical protein